MEQPVQDISLQPVTQPSESQVVSSQPEPVSPKKSFFWPLVVFGLVLLVTLGLVVAFFWVQRGASQEQASPVARQVTDSFSGETLDKAMWDAWKSDSQSNVVIEDGKLVIGTPASASKKTTVVVNSTVVTEEDFEASVDVEIVQGDENSTTGFTFHDGAGGWQNRLTIFLNSQTDGSVDVSAVKVLDGTVEVLGFLFFNKLGPFTLRITRSAGTATFIIDETVIGEATSGVYQGEGRFSFHVVSHEPNFPSVSSSFDNFALKINPLDF